MRCKPGDLALITIGTNRDRLVRVLKLASEGEAWVCEALQSAVVFPGARWVDAGHRAACQDWALRPLRDGPGDDETLTWAGKPEKARHD